jgi:hypothetical protein
MHELHAPQLEAFFEQHIEPKLPKLRAMRQRVWLGIVPVFAVPLLTMIVLNVGTSIPDGAILALTIVFFLVFLVIGAVLYTRFLAEYKAVVVAPLMKQLDAAAVFEPDGDVPQSRVTAAGFLPDTSSYHCEDVVRGRHGESAYEFANITLKTGGKNSKLVFHGLFFQTADPRPRQGWTVVVPSGNEPHSPDEDRELDFQDVEIPGDDMAETFEAFTTHPDEAARLLTPPTMAALVRLSDRLRGEVFASFSPGKVSLAASIGDYFDPGMTGSLVSKEDVARIATIFSTARSIAAELGAGGEDHFDHAFVPSGRRDEPVHSHDAPAAFSAPRVVDAPSLQPLVERLRTRGHGVTLVGRSSLMLEFGTSARMFLALLVPVFWALVGLAVHDRAVKWPSGGTLAEPLVNAVPRAGDALDWLIQFHPALLVPVAIVVALGVRNVNRRYPQRVTLTPSTVESVGGLLPFTRTRCLSPASKVNRLGGYVSIHGTGLSRTAVSPPLDPQTAADLEQLVAGFLARHP